MKTMSSCIFIVLNYDGVLFLDSNETANYLISSEGRGGTVQIQFLCSKSNFRVLMANDSNVFLRERGIQSGALDMFTVHLGVIRRSC